MAERYRTRSAVSLSPKIGFQGLNQTTLVVVMTDACTHSLTECGRDPTKQATKRRWNKKVNRGSGGEGDHGPALALIGDGEGGGG